MKCKAARHTTNSKCLDRVKLLSTNDFELTLNLRLFKNMKLLRCFYTTAYQHVVVQPPKMM